MNESFEGAEVVGRIVLPPDPELVKSLGAHHTLETAIADLIDNSIDARATVVRVRFLTEESRLRAVAVLDDGQGMDEKTINDAMTIGRRRNYEAGSLGNFGLGLKAVGLGVGQTLTVWSRAERAVPVGRRLDKASVSRDFGCEVLAERSAGHREARRAQLLGGTTGTTVVLDRVQAYQGQSSVEAQTWLHGRIQQVVLHLGVVFHRWISNKKIDIEVEQAEIDGTEPGLPKPVVPIDPFGYTAPGRPGYPRELIADVHGHKVRLFCHVWPARADMTGFRMGRQNGVDHQGFYVYRVNRLLQIGGWDAVTTSKPERQLGRIVIEDDSIIGTLVTMNPEKLGIKFVPQFQQAIHRAVTADGTTTFDDYLADLEDTYQASRRRNRQRKPAVRPDKGFTPRLRKAIGGELDFLSDKDPVEIRWTRLPQGEFFDVDFRDRTVWLNSYYRDVLVPIRGGLNDAPLIKALIYLLTKDVFAGEHLGSRDKDDINLWKAVLAVAVEEEWQMLQRRQGDT